MQTVSKLFNGTWRAFKTVVKLFILLTVIGLIIGVATSGTETVDTDTSTPTTEQVKPTVIEKYNIEIIETTSQFGSLTITGTLVADKDYEYLQLEIPCYDSEGYSVGSALANVNNLSKGDKWKFEAIELSGGATEYNLDKAEVTGF